MSMDGIGGQSLVNNSWSFTEFLRNNSIGFENLLGSVYVGQWKKGHRHGLGRLLLGPLHNQQAGELLTSIWNYDSNQKQISKAKVNDWVSVFEYLEILQILTEPQTACDKVITDFKDKQI